MIAILLQQTFIVSSFVIGMMMIIEYLNIQTQGSWSARLQRSPFGQIVLGSIMGIIPGCLGSYTMVSLYIHRVIMFPALVATMIATSGDEAFLMFSLIPKTAIKLHIILFLVALSAGLIVHFTVKNRYIGLNGHGTLPLHSHNHECHPRNLSSIVKNFKSISFTRALLVAGLLTALFLLISGIIDGDHHLNTLMGNQAAVHHEHTGNNSHAEADWIRYSLIALFSILLFIVAIASDHFLQEHLWLHMLKKHFHKIFLWTLGVLIAIHILNYYVDLHSWITTNRWLILAVALLVGIIPESGPHFIFVILYSQGVLPFSILLANSIAQDGHGTLPLLAESRKGFIMVKAVSILFAMAAGVIGLISGW